MALSVSSNQTDILFRIEVLNKCKSYMLFENDSFVKLLAILFICQFLMVRPILTMLISIHYKCRGGLYPRSNIERFIVPDEKVSWSSEFLEYKPVHYTSPHINGKPYADPDIGEFWSCHTSID